MALLLHVFYEQVLICITWLHLDAIGSTVLTCLLTGRHSCLSYSHQGSLPRWQKEHLLMNEEKKRLSNLYSNTNVTNWKKANWLWSKKWHIKTDLIQVLLIQKLVSIHQSRFHVQEIKSNVSEESKVAVLVRTNLPNPVTFTVCG